MGAYEDFVEVFNALPFSGKLDFDKRTIATHRKLKVSSGVSGLYWNGSLAAIDKKTARGNGGDYYVYIWRHAWGEPFYVGSGKGDRWKNKNSRCDAFYPHLDKADAVVYMLLCGVDAHTARKFEQYTSVNLVEAGYVLANGDNNPNLMTELKHERMAKRCKEMEEHELMPVVQQAIVDILNDEPRVDYRITCEFLKTYGEEHFSTAHKAV
jgi:hypothetical protein